MNATNCSDITNSTIWCRVYDLGASYETSTTSTSSTTATSVSIISPLLSHDIKLIFEYIIHIGFFYVVSIFGITVNIINIIVYKKQGLKESITLGYFALSFSDLLVSGMPFETATCYALKFIFPNSHVDFISVHYTTSTWIRDMAYSLSCSITSLLSFERCLCVILPFKVKMIFTRNRTALLIICIFLFHIACYVPIWATHRLRWQATPSRNNTEILRVWFAPHRAIIENFNATLMSIVLPTISQVIVTCCAAVMIHGLRKSSKFRQLATTQKQSANDQDKDAEAKAAVSGQERTVLSPRDARLVRTMVLIVAILSCCNVPFLMLMYAKLAEPELNIKRAYHNTYSFAFSINYVLAGLNACLNFFVYYNTSTKYRDTFKQLFARGSTTK